MHGWYIGLKFQSVTLLNECLFRVACYSCSGVLRAELCEIGIGTCYMISTFYHRDNEQQKQRLSLRKISKSQKSHKEMSTAQDITYCTIIIQDRILLIAFWVFYGRIKQVSHRNHQILLISPCVISGCFLSLKNQYEAVISKSTKHAQKSWRCFWNNPHKEDFQLC